MKKLLCFIASICMTANVAAQTTFSFAGLTWGDPIQTVDSKLKAAGFSGCAMHEKLICKVVASCSCSFEGPTISSGQATLAHNKVESVYVNVWDLEDTRVVLKQKYGPPLPRNRDIESDNVSVALSEMLTSRWRSAAGETLVLGRSKSLLYVSGEKNRKDQSQDRANKSAF